MEPRIENLSEKKLVGKQLTMSLANNKTSNLWRTFMPRRREINNSDTIEMISMQVYNEPFRLGDLNQAFAPTHSRTT